MRYILTYISKPFIRWQTNATGNQ